MLLQHEVCGIPDRRVGFDRDYVAGHDMMCAHFWPPVFRRKATQDQRVSIDAGQAPRNPGWNHVNMASAPERAIQMSMHVYKVAAISLQMPVISGITATAPASADEQSVRRGKAIAVTKCSYCHSIERAGRSPRAAAPPFRTVHKKYPVETLEDALAEGMSTGHPRMPEFRLDPDQVGDFISFLKSLE